MNKEQKEILNKATEQYDNIVNLLTKILIAIRSSK
jgi:hypothetical protein